MMSVNHPQLPFGDAEIFPREAREMRTSAMDDALARQLAEIEGARCPALGRVADEYRNAAALAEETARQIHDMYRAALPDGPIRLPDIHRCLLDWANTLLRDTAEAVKEILEDGGEEAARNVEDLVDDLLVRFRHVEKDVHEMQILVRALTREEIAAMDLYELRAVRMTGPLKATELRGDPEHEDARQQIVDVVKRNFVAARHDGERDDVDIFENEYLHDERAHVFFVTCGEQRRIIAFFGALELGEDADGRSWVYLDWLNANKEGPVRGPALAEATMRSGLARLPKGANAYMAFKPHVRSSGLFIESLNAIAVGKARRKKDGHAFDECKHGYWRGLILPGVTFSAKGLGRKEAAEIRQRCAEPETVYDYAAGGKHYKVCKLVFTGVDHTHDIDAGEMEPFAFGVVRELCEGPADPEKDIKKYVLARYIPDPANRTDNPVQAHYCVFEERPWDNAQHERLIKTLDRFGQEH